jgi:diacylglycerol kinase (ATP)
LRCFRVKDHVRVSLFHNDDAGEGTSLHEIRSALEHHGHELVHVVRKTSDPSAILAIPTDLVVAAGGDGTVSAVARALAKTSIPFTILPLGTANNIAKSLDSHGPIEWLIQSWHSASPRPLDLGVATGEWGTREFVESVGCGLVSAAIAAAKALPNDEGRASSTVTVPDAIRTYLDVLARLKPQRCTLSLDGDEMAGDFLLLEVLNMPSLGPNLVLSRDADPSDGSFTVVMATADHREELTRFLELRLEERDRPLTLPSRPARKVEIRGCREHHVEGKLFRSPEGVSIHIEPGVLQFLA